MFNRLRDKVAIVFGACPIGAGCGDSKATAALFARHGARVVCVDINRAAADETADIITGKGGVASAHACNATDSRAVAELVSDKAAYVAGLRLPLDPSLSGQVA